jgi:hypothetical protein
VSFFARKQKTRPLENPQILGGRRVTLRGLRHAIPLLKFHALVISVEHGLYFFPAIAAQDGD